MKSLKENVLSHKEPCLAFETMYSTISHDNLFLNQ